MVPEGTPPSEKVYNHRSLATMRARGDVGELLLIDCI